MHDERLALDARVHVGVVVHDVAEGPHDERQVREREALLGLPRGLVRAPRALDALEIDPDRRVHVRARRLRAHHVLGGSAADVVERDDLVARGREEPARGRAAAGAGAAGAGAAAGAAGAGAGGGALAAGAPPRALLASTTSLRVMRPPSPVPRISAGSRPSSASMRRTSGEVTRTATAVRGRRCRHRGSGSGRRRGCRYGRSRRGGSRRSGRW